MRRAPLRVAAALLACLVGWPPAIARQNMAPAGSCPDAAGARRDRTGVERGAVQAARDAGWAGQATVSPERRVHILDGDGRGGGHRPGTGLPHKSEFPRGWSDNRIIETIEDVANDPASARRVGPDGRTVVTGHRQGVDVRVVIERDGRSIITGYPTNMPRNPR